MKPKNSSRFDKAEHWPFYDQKSSRSLCKIKNCQNRTHVYCEKCDIHLCFNATRNCFYEYHTQNVEVVESRKGRESMTVEPAKKTRSSDQQTCTHSTVAKNSSRASNSNTRKAVVSGTLKHSRNSAKNHASQNSLSKTIYCLRRQISLKEKKIQKTSASSSNSSQELFDYLKLTNLNK